MVDCSGKKYHVFNWFFGLVSEHGGGTLHTVHGGWGGQCLAYGYALGWAENVLCMYTQTFIQGTRYSPFAVLSESRS